MKKTLITVISLLFSLGVQATPAVYSLNLFYGGGEEGKSEVLMFPADNVNCLFTFITNDPTALCLRMGIGLAITTNGDGSKTVSVPVTVGPKGDTGSQGIQGLPGTDAAAKAVMGVAVKTAVFRTYKSAVMASGVAVFQLTADDLSTGTALYSEVFVDSVQPIVNDSSMSYLYSWVFSNSNKTLTVTVKNPTVVLGALGVASAAANGTVVRLTVEGR